MKTLLLAVALAAVATLAAPRDARASQCSGIEAVISNDVVELDPPTSCLLVEVEAIGCGDDVAVVVTNQCEGPVTLPASLCRADATTCTVAPGETYNAFLREDPDGHVDLTDEADVDGAKVQVHVAYDVEYVDQGDSSMEGGCSASRGNGAGRSGSGAVAAVLGAAILGAAARRKRQR